LHYARIVVLSITLAGGALFWTTIDNGRLEGVTRKPDYTALDTPRFEVNYHRGRLQVNGHTMSSDHERVLLEAATRLSSRSDARATFKPLGVVPDYWMNSTVLLMDTLAATRSANAVLSENRLTIRGVASENPGRQLAALRASLPKSVELSVDVAIPDAGINVAEICARALTRHETGAVNFEESGTVFRSSAYGVLDRIVALADACRNSTVVITGHTDSTGPESWNQQLSLARANAVADYIAEHGIARDRMIVKGAGSSLPVADNRTRYGRGLNRRIDVYLQSRD